MARGMQTLFSAQASDDESDAVQVIEIVSRTKHPGMDGESFNIMATGTFNGATVKLQAGPTKTGPWQDVTDASFTAAGFKVVDISPRFWIRGAVTGSQSTAPSISFYAG